MSLWFLERYKPLASNDNDEYWMTYEYFRCNFGGLIITSGTDPFRPQGFSIKRYYKRDDILDCEIRPSNLSNMEKSANYQSNRSQPSSSYIVRSTQSRSKNTLTTSNVPQKCHSYAPSNSPQDNFVNILFNSRNISCSTNNNEYMNTQDYKKRWTWQRGSSDDTNFHHLSRIESISSVRSQDGESLNGESELHAQGFYYRRKSAPLIGRNFSSSSLSHLTHSSFLATKTDNFRSRGGWKLLVEHRNRWTSK